MRVKIDELQTTSKKDFKGRNSYMKNTDPLRIHMLINYSNNDELLDLKNGHSQSNISFEPCTRGYECDLSGKRPQPREYGGGGDDDGGGGGGGDGPKKTEIIKATKKTYDGADDGDCSNRQSGGHMARGDRRSEREQARMNKEQEEYGNFEWGGTGSEAKLGFLCPDDNSVSIQETKKNGIDPTLHGWQKKGLDVLSKSSDSDCTNIDGKETYMLSARMGSTMATLQHLNEGAFLAVKIHKAINRQAQAFACLLSSAFDTFTAIPFTEVYTDNIYFVGRGFRKGRFDKYALMSKLYSCASLREEAFNYACEKLESEYCNSDRQHLKRFKEHLSWCGDKVYAERFKHDILMCQVYIEGTLDGRIRKRLPWISGRAAKLLNKKVFKRIPSSVRNQNTQTLMCILKSPVGALLKPLFKPTFDPEIQIHATPISDQVICLSKQSAADSARLCSQVCPYRVSQCSEIPPYQCLDIILSLTESFEQRLKTLEDSLSVL